MHTKYCGLMFALTLMGCGQPDAPKTGAPAAAAPINVVKPERKPLLRTIELPGTVEAFEETELIAKVPGFVASLADDPHKTDRPAHDRRIDIGSRVAKDQVLATLAVPELDDEAKQKAALVRQAEAERTQSQKAQAAAQAGIAAAKAMVVEAKAALGRADALFNRWKSEADRAAKMVKDGVMDAQTRDETLNQLKAAQAMVSEAQAKVSTAEASVVKAEADEARSVADVAAAAAKMDVARAEVQRLESLRRYTSLRAPFDGVITRRSISTGDYLTADSRHPAFALARIDPVRVVVNVPEADAGLIAAGQSATIVPGTTGTVARTSWALAPGSRTLRAEVDLPNPKGDLRPGLFVPSKISIEHTAEWSLPAAAIGRIADEPVAYLVEDGKALRVTLQLIRGNGQTTQVKAYRRPGASEWMEWKGTEAVATPAAAVTNGQAIN